MSDFCFVCNKEKRVVVPVLCRTHRDDPDLRIAYVLGHGWTYWHEPPLPGLTDDDEPDRVRT